MKNRLVKFGAVAAVIFSAAVFAGSFPGGWCTSGVEKVKGYIPWSGNAKDWYVNAQKAGYPVAPGNSTGSNDGRGKIIVFGAAAVNGQAGHVAVSLGNGKFIEMNGNPCGGIVSSTNPQCKLTYGKFTESSWPIGGGAPVVGYITYNINAFCPPKGSTWYGSHPSCP